jgi:hypothetical protein
MKIISVDTARTTWLFPLTELNPMGRSFTHVFQGIAERYSFRKFPKYSLDFDKEEKGLIFNEGDFTTGKGDKILVKLSIFTDGIVSDCWSSTRDSEDFLKDVMSWIKSEYGIALPPDRIPKLLYLSELTITSDKNLVMTNPKLEALADRISSKLAASGRMNAGYTFGGYSMWAKNWDQTGAPVAYKVERKANTPLADNRYYAGAPLATHDHIELLEEYEKIIGQ